ncbi:hypothetical protein MHU86_4758 [Fragilaria crotonensis]|nr:hypothetical protein MHU86_4758 [Fragilaria crotonensis]
MTDESVAPPGDASATVTLPEMQDDASDITPPGGSVKRGNQRLNTEKTWKFRFVTDKNNRQDHVSSAKVHLHWLQAVQEAFGDDIQIMTNKGKPLPKVDTVRWTERQHMLHFDVHHQAPGVKNSSGSPSIQHRHASSNQRCHSSFIVHRVRTMVSLQEVKNTVKIYNLLREHKCYLTEHRWSEDIWDTTQLGFLLGLNPQYYDIPQAQEKVMQDLKKNLPPRTKIPKFHMAFITPHIAVKNSVLKTKAYAFETEKRIRWSC